MAKELFLTSSVHAVAHDIAKKIDFSRGRSLAYITTPSEGEEGDKQWLEDDRLALEKAGFITESYTITGKTKEQLEKDLARFDFIYVSGGNTLYMLKKAQESGFVEVARDLVNRGKIYIGTSAGSIFASERMLDYLIEEGEIFELENKEGLGFVDFVIMPHWGSEFFKDKYLDGRLRSVYKNNQIPLILLTDNQYVHVKDDWYQIVSL